MAMTETRPETGATAATTSEQAGPGGLELLVGTGDHRTTGVVFIGIAVFFLLSLEMRSKRARAVATAPSAEATAAS